MKTTTELALADVGAGQWGLLTTPQAVAAGINRMQLSRLNRAGVLTRLAHGVYGLRSAAGERHQDLAAAWLGLDPTRLAFERLADLAADPMADAVVSHASAATLHELGDLDADRHEFTTGARKQTRRQGLRLHRGKLSVGDITRRSGLPVTTPLRTIVDLLADGHDLDHVAGVLADAVRTRQLDLDELADRIGPHAGRRGFGRGAGRVLMDHLLTLGGAKEEADAEQLAALARAHRVSVHDLVEVGDVAQRERLAGAVSAIAVQQEQLGSVLAAVAGAIDDAQLAATATGIAAAMAQVAAAVPTDDLHQQLQRLAVGIGPAARAALDELERQPSIPESTLRALREVTVRMASTVPEPNPEVLVRAAAAVREGLKRTDRTIGSALPPDALAASETAAERARPALTAAVEMPTPVAPSQASPPADND